MLRSVMYLLLATALGTGSGWWHVHNAKTIYEAQGRVRMPGECRTLLSPGNAPEVPPALLEGMTGVFERCGTRGIAPQELARSVTLTRDAGAGHDDIIIRVRSCREDFAVQAAGAAATALIELAGPVDTTATASNSQELTRCREQLSEQQTRCQEVEKSIATLDSACPSDEVAARLKAAASHTQTCQAQLQHIQELHKQARIQFDNGLTVEAIVEEWPAGELRDSVEVLILEWRRAQELRASETELRDRSTWQARQHPEIIRLRKSIALLRVELGGMLPALESSPLETQVLALVDLEKSRLMAAARTAEKTRTQIVQSASEREKATQLLADSHEEMSRLRQEEARLAQNGDSPSRADCHIREPATLLPKTIGPNYSLSLGGGAAAGCLVGLCSLGLGWMTRRPATQPAASRMAQRSGPVPRESLGRSGVQSSSSAPRAVLSTA